MAKIKYHCKYYVNMYYLTLTLYICTKCIYSFQIFFRHIIMNIDDQLRAQSKVLLQRLKARQGKLQNIVHCQAEKENVKNNDKNTGSGVSLIPATETELDASTTVLKPAVGDQPRARQQLARARQSNRKKSDGDECNGVLTDSNNLNTQDKKLRVASKDIYKDSENGVTKPKVVDCDDRLGEDLSNLRSDVGREREHARNFDVKQRRQIIDKNVRVDSQLNESELFKEDDKSKLNFSYSKFDESDINYLRSKFGDYPEVIDIGKAEEEECRPSHENGAMYHEKRLQSAGNDRKVANFIRETMTKPKSILLTTGPKDLKKVCT